MTRPLPVFPLMQMLSLQFVQGYKLLDIKTIPQMPQRSKQFSTHTWTGILKHLHQVRKASVAYASRLVFIAYGVMHCCSCLKMQVANSALEEGIDWSVSLSTERGRSWNTAVASLLFLRGKESALADVTSFNQPSMYCQWSQRPFSCYTSKRSFNSYDKTATLIRYLIPPTGF